MPHKAMFAVRGVKPEDVRIYDAEFYEVEAHCKSCFFCDHCTDIFWDFSNGPYMFVCNKNDWELDVNLISKGLIGKCKSFTEGGE